MESAAQVCMAFSELQPDCVAVELAETLHSYHLHAASRLPDISIVLSQGKKGNALYYMCEPCDSAFEGLRSAISTGIPAYCIDLDVDYYPDIREYLPDPYSIQKIGLKNYYEGFLNATALITPSQIDINREMHMAKRLKELSLQYDRVLFVGGMSHINRILNLVDLDKFPILTHATRDKVGLFTLIEESARDVLAECGWFSKNYESLRTEYLEERKKRTQGIPFDDTSPRWLY